MLSYQNNDLIIQRIKNKMKEINSSEGFNQSKNEDQDLKLINSPTNSNLTLKNPFLKRKSQIDFAKNRNSKNFSISPFRISDIKSPRNDKFQTVVSPQKQLKNEEQENNFPEVNLRLCKSTQGFKIKPQPSFNNINQRFKIIKRLGKGCMADVYSALDLRTNQIVALKVILKTLIKAKNLEDFLCLEIKILTQLDHPNAIKLYGVHDDEKQICLVLELCELNLLQRIQKKQNIIKYDDILRYSYDLISLVSYLHDRNIIHRDIKLENIMLREGIIKLSDFGLAMYVPGLKEGCAYLRGRCGTKGYIAPEVDSNDLYNLKADIYSIGVAIHELYSGEALKEVGVIARNLPPMLADLISKLCQKNPKNRYDAAKILTHPIFKQISDQKNLLQFQDLKLLN